MRKANILVIGAALVHLLATAGVAAAALAPRRLRTEMKENPIGLDVARPRLGWVLESAERGQRQTAYQILVASDPKDLAPGKADLWDSGEIRSDESVHVVYGGAPLGNRRRAHWKVRVWDKQGKPSAWSAPASFETAFLSANEWAAEWIGLPAEPLAEGVRKPGELRWIWCGDEPAPGAASPTKCQIRFAFELPAGATVKRGELLAGATGPLMAWMNNKEVGRAWDSQRLMLMDLDWQTRPGRNLLALAAEHNARGKGPAGVAAELRLELVSGETLVFSSSASTGWKAAPGAAGEAKWSVKPGDWKSDKYDDAGWPSGREVGRFGQGPFADAQAFPQVGPAAYLRRSFAQPAPVRKARLFVTALGLYEMRLNGKRVGDYQLAPGWTDYNKRVPYQTYDVTALVRRGDNVLAAVVGDGWYAGQVAWQTRHHNQFGATPPRLIAQLEIEGADGGTTRIVTDGSWKGRRGPIAGADLLDGESYDARQELAAGWDAAARFDERGFRAVETYRERRNLVADPGPPVRVVAEVKAKSVSEPRPGVYVVDLGQNMVGWVRLKLQGAAGSTVQVRHTEMLNPDGTLYITNLRGAKAADRYTFRGKGTETWEPRFTFHGFRYVELTGLAKKPGLDAITGRVISSDTPPTGTFETSHKMVNQLQHNIVWGQRGNFVSIPTDCPQRDERLGWMGDAQIFVRTACFNMDVAPFFTKWMRDVVDAQSPGGAFPDVAPRAGLGDGAPAWGDAGVIVPWVMYQCYGDKQILSEHYPAFTKWIEYVRSANPDLLWTKRANANYGDWVSVGSKTDKGVLATAFFAQSARLVGRIARVLGKDKDATKHEELFRAIREAFNKAYVAEDGRIKSDTQTAYVLALRFDLLPPDKRPLAAKYLVEDLEKHGNHLTTGFLGVGHLLPALTLAGRDDVAYKLLLKETFPSWGYSIKHGATTIWERWDGWTAEKGFQDPGMNSFNHYSFGSVGEWMYANVAGIDTDPDRPGFKKIVIRPRPGGGLTSARASFDSIRGRIATDWKQEGDTFTLKVEIPTNTTATVTLPPGEAREGGKPLEQAAGVSVVRNDGSGTVVEIGGGRYQFAVKRGGAG